MVTTTAAGGPGLRVPNAGRRTAQADGCGALRADAFPTLRDMCSILVWLRVPRALSAQGEQACPGRRCRCRVMFVRLRFRDEKALHRAVKHLWERLRMTGELAMHRDGDGWVLEISAENPLTAATLQALGGQPEGAAPAPSAPAADTAVRPSVPVAAEETLDQPGLPDAPPAATPAGKAAAPRQRRQKSPSPARALSLL